MLGVVDAEVPAFELAVLPRNNPRYWSFQPIDGSSHGASWRSFNWVARPIEGKTIRLHFSDRLVLPEARTSLRELLYYLGDLGCTTNPEGFWELQQFGLNVIPGTCLAEERMPNGYSVPILVVAKPTIEHRGSLLLRFQNRPSNICRSFYDLAPSWVRLHPTSQAMKCQNATFDEDSKVVIHQHVRIGVKGIFETKLGNSDPIPIYGLSFWFTYCLLASTAKEGTPVYNGRPAGFKMRLGTLYFARECVLPISGPKYHQKWYTFFLENLNSTKMARIPLQWTEDSLSRYDKRLSRRFELFIPDGLRTRSAYFRKRRSKAKEFARGDLEEEVFDGDDQNIYMPLEAFTINPQCWRAISQKATRKLFAPLDTQEPPSSQDICAAACANEQLAEEIASVLLELYSWFKGKRELSTLVSEPSHDSMGVFVCAMIVLEAIADSAGYLASLCDIEDCAGKLQLVYLC
jgi:hypothetical protein